MKTCKFCSKLLDYYNNYYNHNYCYNCDILYYTDLYKRCCAQVYFLPKSNKSEFVDSVSMIGAETAVYIISRDKWRKMIFPVSNPETHPKDIVHYVNRLINLKSYL